VGAELSKVINDVEPTQVPDEPEDMEIEPDGDNNSTGSSTDPDEELINATGFFDNFDKQNISIPLRIKLCRNYANYLAQIMAVAEGVKKKKKAKVNKN